jgi:hypothetical protein
MCSTAPLRITYTPEHKKSQNKSKNCCSCLFEKYRQQQPSYKNKKKVGDHHLFSSKNLSICEENNLPAIYPNKVEIITTAKNPISISSDFFKKI